MEMKITLFEHGIEVLVSTEDIIVDALLVYGVSYVLFIYFESA